MFKNRDLIIRSQGPQGCGATDPPTTFPQVCPRDEAPTLRQRQMDDLRSWGLNSLCSFCSPCGDIPRETTKCIPIVDIPSTLLVHSSEPCSFHDSVSGRGKDAASSRVMSKIPSNIQHWLHSTCNCSCDWWAVVDGFTPNSATSTSRTSHFGRQAISSNPEETDRI